MEFKPLIAFLQKLKKNNNKEWFDKNKKEYEALRKEWLEFVSGMIRSVGAFDKDIAALDAKKCIFRINRDIRFSKDKSPYKTYFGMSLSKTGKKDDFTGYYLHIDPQGSFVAGGSYGPMPDKLAAIRQEIDYNTAEFKKIVTGKDFKSNFGSLTGEKLSRPPKGYEADHEAVEFLKHKSFLAEAKLSEKDLLAKDIDKKIVAGFKAMKPLNDFLARSMPG